MDNVQLKIVIKKLIRSSSCTFLGIYPKDKIPQSLNSYPVCFIANTDVSSSRGKHWVVFYYTSQYDFEFFDSLGHSPTFYNFPLHCIVNCKFLHYPIQSHRSKLCGLYCLY